MKVILVAVVSLNGKLTNGEDPNIYKWTSKEDSEFFFSLVRNSTLVVMGSGTYNAMRDRIKVSDEKLTLVLTSDPSKHESIPGKLEFSTLTPREVFEQYKNEHSEMLLAGGSRLYASFLKEGLVDEIYLTIEPVLFKSGKPLFEGQGLNTKLELFEYKKLNELGTVLLKYKVINES